jgi:hypothetical protein
MFALRPLPREHLVTSRSSSVLLLLAVVACGGPPGPSASTGPAPTPEQAVRSFMQAAADSNLGRMAQLWGTRAGPAAKTGQPSDYERRITIMQFYLSGSPFRIVPGGAAQVEPAGGAAAKDRLPVPGEDPANIRQVVVQLDRQGCAKYVPFVVVRTLDNSWIVNQVDLAAAGHPKRPCTQTGPARDSTAGKDST